jgi:serine/threonine-protein kinase
MARVYEATHLRLGNRVAIKVMNAELLAQPLASARFVREATVAAQIRHPNVVRVFDVGTVDGVPFIVMDLVEGPDLAAVLRERGPLPLTQIADVLLPVLDAIASAHDVGIVHRDLKPANLMLGASAHRGAHPMLLDFGISKLVDEPTDTALTTSQALLGTLQYMAPELTRGARFATAASDQYALGVILYECATGRRPFSGDNSYDLMHAIVTQLVLPPSRVRQDLPPEFDALVQRAMSRDPSARFPSVRALGSALLSFADRTVWALWQNKFLGITESDSALGATEVTAIEPDISERSNSSRVRRLGPKVAFPVHSVLAAYAVATTLALLVTLVSSFTRRDDGRGAPVAPTTAAVLNAALPADSPGSSAPTGRVVEVSPAPARTGSQPQAAEPEAARSEGVRVRAATATATATATKFKDRFKVRPEPTARRDGDLGSNEAPILE